MPHQHKPDEPVAGAGTRRTFIAASLAAAAGAAASVATGAAKESRTGADPYADPAAPALPPSTITLHLDRTALVITILRWIS
jgi:biuret amidohydrolase